MGFVSRMNNIEEIKEINSKVHSIAFEPFTELLSNSSKYPIENTIRTLAMFCTRIEFIKNAIITLYDEEDIYSSKILYRSLIEHYLRFEYLFFKYQECKNDEPVNEYNLFSDLSEDIEYGKSWQLVRKINNANDQPPDIYTVLQNIKPEIEKYSIDEIKNNISKYRYRNIIRYLEEKLYSSKSYDVRSSFLLNIIPEYSELSSYVHGGVFAEKEIIRNSDEHLRKKELFRILKLSLLISITTKEFFFIIGMQYDKKYKDVYHSIRNIRVANA